MRTLLRSIAWFLGYPPSWMLAGIAFMGTLIFVYDDASALIAVGTVSALLFTFVSLQGVNGLRAREFALQARRYAVTARRAGEILDRLPIMAWRCNARGLRTYVSPHYLGITGLTEDDALGDGWLKAIHPDDLDLCRGAMRLAAVNREPYEVEYRLRCDGIEIAALDRAVPSFNVRGAFEGFVGITLDVTQWKNESNFEGDDDARLNRSIASRLTELIDDYEALLDARQQADVRERSQREFLLAVGSELEQPLRELRDVTAMLGRTEDASALPGLVDRLDRCAEGLAAVTEHAEQIHGLAEEEPAIAPFNLRRLVDHVVDRCRESIDEENVALSVAIGDHVPAAVRADPIGIRAILQGLWSAGAALAKTGRLTFRVTREGGPGDHERIQFSLVLQTERVDVDLVERASYPIRAVGDGRGGLGLGALRTLARSIGGDAGIISNEDGSVTIWANAEVEDMQPHSRGRRNEGRHTMESVQSSLGPVIDIARSGARVQTTRPPKGSIELTISDDEEETTLTALVAWTRRVGFGRHEVGLRFLEMDNDAALIVSRIAMRNRMRRVMSA